MEIKSLLDTFFERAIITTSYSAADKLNELISKHNGVLLRPVFIIFTISIAGALTILNSNLLQNSGIQTTLAILMSKLIISLFPLTEEQKTYSIFATAVFYLVFWSAMCTLIKYYAKHNDQLNVLWEKIVPFIVIFTSLELIRIMTENHQMLLFYLIALSYLVIIQYYSTDILKASYIFLFIDSFMCRSVVLTIQDYIHTMVDNMDIAVIIFNCGLLILTYTIASKISNLPSQVHYCLGVIVFTISRQIFTLLQKYANNKLSQTFVIIIIIFNFLLFNQISKRLLATPVLNICINCIALSWTMMLDFWFASFYGIFEPFFIYFIVFIFIQKIKNSTSSVIDFTEGNFSNKEQMSILNAYEIIVITHVYKH
jgi:hypothetical protein